MSREQLISTVLHLTRAISGDPDARVTPLPIAGNEQTLELCAPKGMGRLLGSGGETFRALRRVVNAAAWHTGFAFKLVIDDPRDPGRGGDRRDERSEAFSKTVQETG